MLGREIGLSGIERPLAILGAVDIGGQNLLVLIDGHGILVPALLLGTACGIAVRLPAFIASLGAGRHSHDDRIGIDDAQIVPDRFHVGHLFKIRVNLESVVPPSFYV